MVQPHQPGGNRRKVRIICLGQGSVARTGGGPPLPGRRRYERLKKIVGQADNTSAGMSRTNERMRLMIFSELIVLLAGGLLTILLQAVGSIMLGRTPA